MSQRSGVLCAGSVVVDAAKVIDAYPSLDTLAVIESVNLGAGGPALNLAVDLARLGARYPLGVIGVVGADRNGAVVRETLQQNGIDASGLIEVDGAVTSFTDAMIVRDSGRRTFFHHVGANGLIAPSHIDLDGPQARQARILHLGAPGLHPLLDAPPPAQPAGSGGGTTTDQPDGGNGWSTVLAAARARGLRTNLELVTLAPQRNYELVRPCLPHLDSLVVNEIEACAVAGRTPPPAGPDDDVDWAALVDVAAELIGLGVHGVVAVHFPHGAVAVTADGQRHRQGSVRLPPSEIVNATGAGDAFAAGVVHGLHEGWALPQCLQLGVCAAAAGLRGGGTHDGLMAMADCLELGDRFGYRPS